MHHKSSPKHSLEILEQRIAPAALLNEAGFKTGVVGTPLLLTANQGLSTGGANAGTYLLYVEKGSAFVFTTDFNNNNAIDFNEITGIAAGDGLRLISFVDIHGDIVTNLRADTRLSDSDNDPSNDSSSLKGDGRVLLNSTIEKIELRSLTVNDIGDQNGVGTVDATGKLIADQADVAARLALSSYSIFGNVLAGGGFGIQGDKTSGLIIDDAGKTFQAATFIGGGSVDYYVGGFRSSIGSIKVGTAASDTPFAFSVSAKDDIQGRIVNFIPTPGAVGAGIFNVRAASSTSTFNLNSLESGDGGIGAKGGDIANVTLNGDNAGGYQILAGNGGDGTSGGDGGSIIGLSDLGSVTGRVLLKTGNGGRASTKTGGNGGSLSFGTVNLNGDVQVILGDGGDGFTAGGNGSSILNGVVNTPSSGKYTISQVVSTTIGGPTASNMTKIGTPLQVDFNEDGNGDFVYTTNNPSQLVVVFGTPTGVAEFPPLIQTLQISLGGPINAEAVVVADFNGDGHLDIAAASSEAGSFDGISVFLSKFTNPTDPTIKPTLIGFDSPLHSTLPALFDGDAIAGSFRGANQGLHRSATAIGSMTAGDFDHNGTIDLAVVATYYKGVGNSPVQVPIILSSDIEGGKPTGQFYADFGVLATTGLTPLAFDPMSTTFPAFFNGDTGSVIAHASFASSAAAANHALLYIGQKNGAASNRNNVYAFDNDVKANAGARLVGTYNLGRVDTNRLPAQGNNPNISLEAAELSDFAIGDIDNDGNADVAILTSSPTPDFLILIAGTATGAPRTTSQPYLSDPPVITAPADQTAFSYPQNAGISFKVGDGVTFGTGSPQVALKFTAAGADGLHNDLAILNYGKPGVDVFTYQARTNSNDLGGSVARLGPITGNTNGIIAFDSYTPKLTGRSQVIAGDAFQGDIPNGFEPVLNQLGNASIVYPVRSGFSIKAGDGGDALVGRGGIGGSIGSGIKTGVDPFTGLVDAVGSVDLTFALSGAISTYQAGIGGNGFTTGGKGGSVSGLVVRTEENSTTSLLDGINFSTIMVRAGSGGFGVSGAGGDGGDISKSSIEDAVEYTAGNGGRGKTGGAGGAIIGNRLPNIFDTQGTTLVMKTGLGGDGVKAAGSGGSVVDFRPNFTVGAAFYITTGNGGASVSGAGGSGGSILNTQPFQDINLLSGEILFTAGNGGRGRTGGLGGSINGFVDSPTTQDNPTIVSMLAGNGGDGIAGKGGNGGSLVNLTIPSTGATDPAQLSPVSYDRFLAGNGGNSSGSVGGTGGLVFGLKVDATNGSMAVTAGAGGDGLRGGGVGGSVSNNQLGVGGSPLSKLLVIAGKGGDSLAFPLAFPVLQADGTMATNPNKTFGGFISKAGDGGSITNLTQSLGADTRIDLIAGNGGDTTRFGTLNPAEKTFVGKGGSVLNVNAIGNLGNTNATTPLKSYNDTGDTDQDGRINQTLAQFVQTQIRGGLTKVLSDDKGMVGVVVGAAGRLRTVETSTSAAAAPTFISLPSNKGVNGSFQNINARSLVSAIAGSIDRVAAIQLVSGIQIGPGAGTTAFTPEDVGTDKGVIGTAEYRNPDGTISNSPTRDGKLIDGAVYASKVVTLPGDPTLSGRVFIA